jgi:hypothetical protein
MEAFHIGTISAPEIYWEEQRGMRMSCYALFCKGCGINRNAPERLETTDFNNGIEEVVGSIPSGSTTLTSCFCYAF